MLNELIQLLPAYLALDAAFRRGDPEAMRRWICCWAATICFLLIFDYVGQGLVIKSVMLYQLARQDADWASMIVSRMVSDPLLLRLKMWLDKTTGRLQAIILYYLVLLIRSYNRWLQYYSSDAIDKRAKTIIDKES